MKYRYFISYFYVGDRGTGLGRTECIRNERIKDINEVKNIEEILKEKTKFKEVIILNWRLFNDRV